MNRNRSLLLTCPRGATPMTATPRAIIYIGALPLASCQCTILPWTPDPRHSPQHTTNPPRPRPDYTFPPRPFRAGVGHRRPFRCLPEQVGSVGSALVAGGAGGIARPAGGAGCHRSSRLYAPDWFIVLQPLGRRHRFVRWLKWLRRTPIRPSAGHLSERRVSYPPDERGETFKPAMRYHIRFASLRRNFCPG